MKKVSIVSMLAVLAISTAASANVENPLYAPAKGKLYSKTSLAKADSTLTLQQKFGYGITNRLVIDGFVNYIDQDKDDGDDGFGSFNIGGAYRLSSGSLITDVYAHYETAIDEDVPFGANDYTAWDAGLKFGKRTAKYTIAAQAGVENIDLKDLDMDTNNIILGLEGAYTFDDRVSGNLGLKYTITDDFNRSMVLEDTMALTAQVNYLKGGLWSLAYTHELKADDVDNVWTVKYGLAF
ncbi:MAG: hypothetical protein IKP65_03855 [Alphaproteobacteria bacterium]|nr:hypothetical protein [Alphaproteobacteria bacterium]